LKRRSSIKMDNLGNISIGMFIKFKPQTGEEPYFTLLMDFKNSFVGTVKSKDEEDILLFNVDDIETYKDVYEGIKIAYKCRHEVVEDKKFFMRNMKNYLSEGKGVYEKYPCNVAIFSDDNELTRYFVDNN